MQRFEVIIIHGSYASPEENWFPWIRRKIEADSHSVSVPALPTPEGQTFANWKAVFEQQFPKLNKNMVLIGHSIGPAFILRLLEKTSTPIAAAFLVSGFVSPIGIDKFDSINRSFLEDPFDWEAIKRSCGRFYMYHSDNDPYVPLERARYLEQCLSTPLRLILGGGHLNQAAGYSEFTELYNDFKQFAAGSAYSNR